MSQNYGISVKGGDEIELYAFSVGYNKSEGNIENTDFNRLNVRFNSDIHLTDKLKFLFDIEMCIRDRKICILIITSPLL